MEKRGTGPIISNSNEKQQNGLPRPEKGSETSGKKPISSEHRRNFQYLQDQTEQGKLNRYQLSDMIKLLDQMVDVAGICERILKTPMPLAYSIHLKQLLMIYSLSLPFQFVDQVEWLTAPLTVLISFTLLGIEEIGIQIEDPFGHDSNDLPLDNICNAMQRNIEDLLIVSHLQDGWDADDLKSLAQI